MKYTAVFHSYIAKYRDDLFKGIDKLYPIDVFCYEDIKKVKKENKKIGSFPFKVIFSFYLGPFLYYTPKPFLKKKYKNIVLMLNFTHITTWFLLLSKIFHKKKIILWGHGISIKRFLKEKKKPSKLLKLMIFLADEIWFYTEHELKLWTSVFPDIKAVSLNNTISNVDKIIQYDTLDKEVLKLKNRISHRYILIFCARFTSAHRRIDLLIKAIESLDQDQFGFIIIGDGNLKPNLKKYSNVYDFGELYDNDVKKELFQLSDIYFQPGWVGLSIVEAMAYGLPIFTFRRSHDTLQCVEYTYIQHNFNGLIFDNFSEFVEYFDQINESKIKEMSESSKLYAKNYLTMENMVFQATKALI